MHFTFNGFSSVDYNLKVQSSNHLSRPAKKIEQIEVPGRTGDLIIDDGSKSNLTISIVCLVDCRLKEDLPLLARSLSTWLQDPIGYQDLIFSDGMKFKAICTNQIDIEEVVKSYGSIAITFSAVEVTE